MLRCYCALIELAHSDSAIHAEAILDHLADYHAAVVRAEAGQPALMITLPAEDLAHAIEMVHSLLRVTGHRPIRVEVMTSDELDYRS